MNSILELLFKGLLQWLFDLIINITEYLANSLLTIFNMDLAYFEAAVPITSYIITIMTSAGWALMLGNLLFQSIKSMASGLGFDGEDPKTLFTRTFAMSFFLMCSRQICEIGLGITKKVIDLLMLPTAVQVPVLSEDTFSVPGDASWLLVIIVGIILVVQIVKLFFEIAERYVIVSVLTIISPLAFSMGGSKNTADIFKGWARMFASMCLMMVLSIVFLKMILSAMSVVPSGVEVIPWAVFAVALAKAGKKIDGLIARIGLNPAMTGEPLGRSRIPGMLTQMVVKNIAASVGKAAAANKADSSHASASRPELSSGSSELPSRPPIGSASKSASPATSGSRESGAHTTDSHTTDSHTSSAEGAAKYGDGTRSRSSTRPPASTTARSASTASDKSTSHSTERPSTERTSAPATASERSTAAPKATTPTAATPKSAKPAAPWVTAPRATSPKSTASKVTAPSAPTSPKADVSKATSTKDTHPSSGVTSSDSRVTASASEKAETTAPAKADMPLADKIKPAMASDGSGHRPASGTSTVKGKDSHTDSSSTPRPTRPEYPSHMPKVDKAAPASKAEGSVVGKNRPSTASITGKSGDVSSTTNVTHEHKTALPSSSPPRAGSVTSGASRPGMGRMPTLAKGDSSKVSTKPSTSELSTTGTKSESAHSSGSDSTSKYTASSSGTGVRARESYKTSATRPDTKGSTSKISTSSSETASTRTGTGTTTSSTPHAGAAPSRSTSSGADTTKTTGSRPATHNIDGVPSRSTSVPSSTASSAPASRPSTAIPSVSPSKIESKPPYKPGTGSSPSDRRGGK